ncbi:unnamed protein product [Allacma fusca]|uniref:Uncharacterized protein n=1 Tax=Allacma fusca TaxID=39272 RepID=A0A8J2J0C6_9HEXA|nr:unnamed protein product [Allacma fusca]
MGSQLDFTGRRVLVTGGGRGIGLAIVKKFLEYNATVIVLEKNESLLQNLKEDLPSLTEKDIDITFDVNFKSYVHVAQVVVKDMIKNKVESGTIVNISSAADQRSFTPDIPLEIYSCSKAAVSTLTRVLAAEFSSAGIRMSGMITGASLAVDGEETNTKFRHGPGRRTH